MLSVESQVPGDGVYPLCVIIDQENLYEVIYTSLKYVLDPHFGAKVDIYGIEFFFSDVFCFL